MPSERTFLSDVGWWCNGNRPYMAMVAMVLGGEAHCHGGGGRQGYRPLSFYTSNYSYVGKVDGSFRNGQAQARPG